MTRRMGSQTPSGASSPAPRDADGPLEICLFGAALDTGNRGVSALSTSVIEGVLTRAPDARITLFDNSMGTRTARVPVAGREHAITLMGARGSRRLYRSDSLDTIRFCGRFGGLGNPAIRVLRRAHAALDITGGDSFSDIYGPAVFRRATLPKHIVLEQSVPLILLPQTYGPYTDPACRAAAEQLIQRSHAAWARDERSFAELQVRLGAAFDPDRHHCGIDVAFGLQPREPWAALDPEIRAWLEDGDSRESIGFNVSGLIRNEPDRATLQYGLRTDYREAVHRILTTILEESECRILLLPHVVTRPGHFENDLDACEAVRSSLAPRFQDRIRVAWGEMGPGELKGLIARCAWFCGTRMHATIAGLSSGVPTSTLAYSGKALGVFEGVGQAEHVADMRALETDAAVAGILGSFRDRAATRTHLSAQLPRIVEAVKSQMDSIVNACMALPRRRAA